MRCQHYGNVPLDEIEMYVHGLKKFSRPLLAADLADKDTLNSGEGSSITTTFCMRNNPSKNVVPLDEIAMLESGLLDNQGKKCCPERENSQPSEPIEVQRMPTTKPNNES
uniref:Uncharacterized protein n=1 Tax=Romanomermis culicivorax TaxID=13658 RepID=A0A915ICC9_ROMCU